MKVSAE
jgi:hypothetical protein